MTGRWLRVVLVTAWCLPALVSGQAPAADEALFADAVAKETAVRDALGGPLAAEAVLRAVRTVVGDYQHLARQHPDSRHADDALWNAATLSLDAFKKYGDQHDQAMAVGLLRRLETDYTSSPLARKAEPAMAQASNGPAPARASPKIVTISGIEREVMADAIRVTIALDGEAPFREERLSNPERYYVDLSSVKLGPDVSDGTLRFDGDTHPVRQIRIGRHPNNVVRVVLEAAGIATCSAYPVYSPHRLVLECVPEGARAAAPVSTGAVPRPFPLPGAATRPAPAPPPPPPPLAARVVDPGWGRVLPLNRPGAAWLSDAVAAAGARDASAPLVSAAPPSRNLAGGFSIARQLGLGVSRIVIDPGHGGQDPGTKAGGTSEAEIVLDVALRIEKLFEGVPGIEVILTRRSDVFVPLEERTAMANRENADLFLSIHVNGSRNRQAGGVETYFLNFATTQDAAEVAARENAASGQSMAELPEVVKAITLDNKRDESRELATIVQRELVASLRTANAAAKDIGVKQAPFVVLIGAQMPSVLAEVSFLTNAQEARLLKSTTYRQRIAQGLFDAIRKYQTALKTEAVALQ